MESAVHAAVPLRVGKKMRKRRELDALVGGGGSRGGRLLSASSDEGEPWGRRTSRRRRSRPFMRLAAGLAFCVCVVSAATVLWLFVDVRRQISSLRLEMDGVSRSNVILNDALQMCHATAKEFTANASDLSFRLEELKKMHLELENRVNQTIKNLTVVSGQLSAAPKLADAPRTIADLKRLVAQFGSQISGFDSTVQSNTKQAHLAVAGVEEVRTLLNQLEAKTNDTIANVTANFKRNDDIKSEIAGLNNTLTSKLVALEERIQEISKPVSTVPPAAPQVVAGAAPTTPPPANATTTSSALPPDMCPKPNDTQTELSKTSYVEELADGVPGLFAALTSDPDPQQRWLSITYPVDIDLSAYRPVPEKQLVYHIQSLEQESEPVNRDIVTLNCTVAYMSQCMSCDKCRASCRSMGANSLRWFHDGCCECVGDKCLYYGINESRCLACPGGKDTSVNSLDEDLSYDDLDYGEDVDAQSV